MNIDLNNKKFNENQFKEMYKKLYDENFKELEELRVRDRNKKIFTTLSVIFGIVLLFCIYFIGINVYVLIALILFACFMFKKWEDERRKKREATFKKSYAGVYKEKIIKPMLELVFSNYEYLPEEGIIKKDYIEAFDEEPCDNYESEDLIKTNIKVGNSNLNVLIAENHIREQYSTKDGYSLREIFFGEVIQVDLTKSLEFDIKIRIKKKYLKDILKTSMAEFNEKFYVSSSDNEKAKQLLSLDFMQELINLHEQFSGAFDFNIKNNILYVRYHTPDFIFEPNSFGKAMKYDDLKKYIGIIFDIKYITEKIINQLES